MSRCDLDDEIRYATHFWSVRCYALEPRTSTLIVATSTLQVSGGDCHGCHLTNTAWRTTTISRTRDIYKAGPLRLDSPLSTRISCTSLGALLRVHIIES